MESRSECMESRSLHSENPLIPDKTWGKGQPLINWLRSIAIAQNTQAIEDERGHSPTHKSFA